MKVDVSTKHTISDLTHFSHNIGELIPGFIATLSEMGNSYAQSIEPVRTGALRRNTHTAPTTNPNTIVSDVNYAYIANLNSKSPHFIERTIDYIEKIIPDEADRMITQALNKV